MENTQLMPMAKQMLMQVCEDKFTYDAANNMFVSDGYTSLSQNFYFCTLFGSQRMIIRVDHGRGYSHHFLNGITIYCTNGGKSAIVAERHWGGCGNWCDYSNAMVVRQSLSMLKDLLLGEAKMQGNSITEDQALDLAGQLLSETRCKLLTQH
jgi:hypothetical protein